MLTAVVIQHMSNWYPEIDYVYDGEKLIAKVTYEQHPDFPEERRACYSVTIYAKDVTCFMHEDNIVISTETDSIMFLDNGPYGLVGHGKNAPSAYSMFGIKMSREDMEGVRRVAEVFGCGIRVVHCDGEDTTYVPHWLKIILEDM
jgi:hypothetical protein